MGDPVSASSKIHFIFCRQERQPMIDLLLVLSGCFTMGVFMLLLLDPSHEACKPEVRK